MTKGDAGRPVARPSAARSHPVHREDGRHDAASEPPEPLLTKGEGGLTFRIHLLSPS